MLFALLICHKIPIAGVWQLKRPKAEYVPVLGSTPSIPTQQVELPKGSVAYTIPGSETERTVYNSSTQF